MKDGIRFLVSGLLVCMILFVVSCSGKSESQPATGQSTAGSSLASESDNMESYTSDVVIPEQEILLVERYTGGGTTKIVADALCGSESDYNGVILYDLDDVDEQDLEIVEEDRNGDGIIDRFEYYVYDEDDMLLEEQVDLNGDGEVDRVCHPIHPDQADSLLNCRYTRSTPNMPCNTPSTTPSNTMIIITTHD